MHALEKRILLPEDLEPIETLEEYRKRGGFKALEKARSMSSEDLIAEVRNANLRGRGGAGFPTAIKWQTVYSDPAENKYVVCNFAEGEPGTFKDRYLVSKNPYSMFEGMLIAAHAIKAKQAIVGTKQKFKAIVDRITSALKEIEEAGLVEPGYLKIVLGPDAYLFGEEKALLEVINGRGAYPTHYPPYMMGVGASSVDVNPTVVNNCESMSHLPHIVNNGADWFKSMGTEDTPGTIILSLSGDVKKPGMYEVEAGLTVKQMLFDLGGGPRGDKPFRAVFSGVANRVMTPDQFDLKVDFGTLRSNGVGLGSGGFMVYDESRCMVDVALMFSKFLAISSCGQCIPCNNGCRTVTDHLEKIQNGEGSKENIDAIKATISHMTNGTRCFLPVQESVLVQSVIDKFPQEFEYHTTHGCNYNDHLTIPKLQDYDEDKGDFVYESDPIEFRGESQLIL